MRSARHLYGLSPPSNEMAGEVNYLYSNFHKEELVLLPISLGCEICTKEYLPVQKFHK